MLSVGYLLMDNAVNGRYENKLLVRKLGPATIEATLEATIESSLSVALKVCAPSHSWASTEHQSTRQNLISVTVLRRYLLYSALLNQGRLKSKLARRWANFVGRQAIFNNDC